MAALDLSQSGDRTPQRLTPCIWNVTRRMWFDVESYEKLPPAGRMMCLSGYEFQVDKARGPRTTCARCGEKMDKWSIRISFPFKKGSLIKSAYMHVKCAANTDRLVELAVDVCASEMKRRVLGFDALTPPERRQVLADIKGSHREPEEPPAESERPVLCPAEPPQDLHATMFPFQKEGLGWMLRQEADEQKRGGILADEMGMGKTLQTIALVLSTLSSGRPTLVLSPACAVDQWLTEIAKFAPKISAVQWSSTSQCPPSVDMIIASYQTLEREHRELDVVSDPPRKRRRTDCGDGNQSLLGMAWHRVVLDEAHRIRCPTNSTTKAVFRLNATMRWCLTGTPIQNRIGDLYPIIRFLQFQPYCAYRCTAEGCECSMLDWSFDNTNSCKECGHPKQRHRSRFFSEIARPIQTYGFCGSGKTALETLRRDVLDRIQLRRTKTDRGADVRLPELKILALHVDLTPKEKRRYDRAAEEARDTMMAFAAQGSVMQNIGHVFALLSRLRQLASHPFVVPVELQRSQPTCVICSGGFSSAEQGFFMRCEHAIHKACALELFDLFESGQDLPCCPLCKVPGEVLRAIYDHEVDLAGDANRRSRLNRQESDISVWMAQGKARSSSKLDALADHVVQALAQEDKVVIFSSFVRMLELIRWRLEQDKVTVEVFFGGTTPVQRKKVLQRFRTDAASKVLLVSLMAGSEGLNLQSANHVFLLDPWWNPAMELQAIQRVHRIGQTKPVTAIRFVANGTVEERIVKLQRRKRLLMASMADGTNAPLAKMTGQDVQQLFGM